jgi:hypothetical protein
METNRCKYHIFIISIIILVTTVLAGCVFPKCDDEVIKEMPEGIPMEEFVIGNWLSESAYSLPDNQELGYIYEIRILKKGEIKWLYFEPEGQFVDGDTWPYYFLDENTIYWDILRIQGGETWHLVRDGQKLKINMVGGGLTTEYVFKRGSFRCDYKKPIK